MDEDFAAAGPERVADDGDTADQVRRTGEQDVVQVVGSARWLDAAPVAGRAGEGDTLEVQVVGSARWLDAAPVAGRAGEGDTLELAGRVGGTKWSR